MLKCMAKANPKSIQELEAQKKAIKEAAAAEVAAIRKATAEKVAALKASERRLRALDIREQKKRENHAKILVGVAMINQCQTSEGSASKFKALLEEFYSDSPERLKAALYGLTLTVKKPANDAEQD
jgi:transcriptional regulatory protein LevR